MQHKLKTIVGRISLCSTVYRRLHGDGHPMKPRLGDASLCLRFLERDKIGECKHHNYSDVDDYPCRVVMS